MARRPSRAAGGEEFIRRLVQSNSFVIAKVCTGRQPRGLSVGFASEYFLSLSVTAAALTPRGVIASPDDMPTAFLELERVTGESLRFPNTE